MNYYEILEVNQNASLGVIKAAYKNLMQRYHPDKNPGNAEIGERALLVIQAYEVLSDSSKRAAYDIRLGQQLSSRGNNIPGKSRAQALPVSGNRPAPKEKKHFWFVWALITVTIVSSLMVMSRSKNEQSPETELKEIRRSLEGNQLPPDQLQAKFKRMDEIFRDHPEILRREASERAKEGAARTIPVFVEKLTVNLRTTDKSSGEPARVLSIPILGVKVGTFDSEKVIRHIENQKELITQKLAEKLADADFEKLLKVDGEHYLKKIILDSIGDTTGTDRFEDYPSSSTESPGRYGVIEVFLPESYSVQ